MAGGEIMRLAMELLFVLFLGLLIPGPKRLHSVLAHAARANAELENVTRVLKSRLATELDDSSDVRDAFWSNEFLKTCRNSSTSESALLVDNRAPSKGIL
jgi:Sec-independent protein translocase protein TatA